MTLSAPPASLAERINSYLIHAIQIGRLSVNLHGFLASIDTADPNPYRNYAVPLAGASPSQQEVSALVNWFRDHHRKPRLEYMAEAAPAVEAALIAAGFSLEGRLPLLTVAKLQLTTVTGIEVQPATSKAQLHEAAVVQNVVYGSSQTTDADVTRLSRTVARGGSVLVARESTHGAVVGAGLYSIPSRGVTEIAAIGVLESFRRRDIATALSAALAESALNQGIATPFLMAAGPVEQRIYQRAGFVPSGQILHMSLTSQT